MIQCYLHYYLHISDTYHRPSSSVHTVWQTLYTIRIRVDRVSMVAWVTWGRPHVNTRLSDKDPLTERCVYGSPNTTETILMNSQIYHKSQVSWSTLSKAFFRSRKITALIFPISIFCNLRNSFFGLSLDNTDHVTQIRWWLSDDIRRPIWYPSSNYISMKGKPKN